MYTCCLSSFFFQLPSTPASAIEKENALAAIKSFDKILFKNTIF